MGNRGNLRKARFYSVLCAEENHRAETGGGVAAAVGCSGGDGISHEKKLGLLIAGGHQPFAIRGPPADWLGFLDLHSKRRYARCTGVILEVLDRVGRICRLGVCRGGLILTATRDV